MSIDKTWHLASSEKEVKITEFELQLWRVYYGFIRWQEECEKIANNDDLSSDELAVLHIIRMKDRPKTVNDIGRLLNRDNFFSINYNVSKLLKLGLVQKIGGVKKQYIYAVTEKGIKYTDAYTEARRNILIKEFEKDLDTINLDGMASDLMKLKGIYEEAVRVASSYQPASNNNNKETEKNNKKK